MIDTMESEYFESIVSIRDKLHNEYISKDDCCIQKIASTYSNTKVPIYKLLIKTKPISRNNSYLICYKCLTCDIESEITLNLFIRKINKDIRRCEACRNKNEDKCKNQSKFMKENIHKIIAGEYVNPIVKVKSKSLEEHIQTSKLEYEEEDEDFKNMYKLRHLTSEDFDRIKTKIISIGNDKICSLDSWTYFPTFRIYNQSKYTPMLIHKCENRTEKPIYIKFRCENCECEFTHRDLEIVKNHLKLLCQSCSLTNRIFHLRKMVLKNGNNIMWQSILERRFIEWCEENNIRIQNGPKIQYMFKDNFHTYKVDFELPDYKKLVEIKDNHCWHNEQVKSGKFEAKETAAINWCNLHQYTYHVIYPKTMQKFKDSLLSITL